jgi:hypothetical protein
MKTPRSENKRMERKIERLLQDTDDSMPMDIRLQMVELKLLGELNDDLEEVLNDTIE